MRTSISIFVLGFILLTSLTNEVIAQTPVGAADAKKADVPKATLGAINATPRPIEIADMATWKVINSVSVSANGLWSAWRIAESEGDGTVVVKSSDRKKEWNFPAGQGNGNIEFSLDGNWFAFTLNQTKKEQESAKKAKKPVLIQVGLVELQTGKLTKIERIRKFSFAPERGGWIAMHKASSDSTTPPAPTTSNTPAPNKVKGSDLLLRDLTTGLSFNVGNVAEFEFDKTGHRLAYIIDANEKAGNGLVMHYLDTGVTQVLDEGDAVYEKLLWNDEGTALTVLKGVEDKSYVDKLWSAIGFRQLDSKSFQKTLISTEKLKDFPEGMTISSDTQARWSDDFAWISFGIKDAKKKPKEEKKENESEEKVNLVLWHYQDKRLPTQQKVQQDADKKRSSAAIFRIAENKFLRLGDEQFNHVTFPKKGDWALARDDSEYQRQGSMDGKRFSDIYSINLKTGQRQLIQKQARFYFGMSLDGRFYLDYQEGHFYSVALATGKRINLTENIPANFVDVDDDHNVAKPPVAPFGWASDNRSILLSDGWDIWKVQAEGGKAVRLSQDGQKDQIRYERRFTLDPDEKGIDLKQPQYFSAYGEWNKKAGFLRVDPNGNATRYLFEDASYRRLVKAENADVFVLSKESATAPPDLYATTHQFNELKKLTDLTAQEKQYQLSSGSMLVHYVGTDGKTLQGALFLPTNYEAGKKYPTIVYIYEKLSQGLNTYSQPVVGGGGFNRAYYTSHGYAVFNPDIAYRLNDPGVSAKESVLPALKAAIETGVVDAARVGLQGHSWGGYQTAFLVTQTNAFKAASAGAALTNMISMYSLVYKNSGSANQAIFESSQGRFLGNYNDHLEAYIRNSPVFFAKNVNTPLLMLQNDVDGAVDYTQGVEYFNTLRRAGKDVVMLEYPGENHGLVKKPNQKDYMLRMKEFFDFHLKDKPAPEWLSKGVAWLKMEDHLKERASLVAPAAAQASDKKVKDEDADKKEERKEVMRELEETE
jgi:dipeptidyl aminopeptidase/acylaminoacyl peptidase